MTTPSVRGDPVASPLNDPTKTTGGIVRNVDAASGAQRPLLARADDTHKLAQERRLHRVSFTRRMEPYGNRQATFPPYRSDIKRPLPPMLPEGSPRHPQSRSRQTILPSTHRKDSRSCVGPMVRPPKPTISCFSQAPAGPNLRSADTSPSIKRLRQIKVADRLSIISGHTQSDKGVNDEFTDTRV